MRTTIYAILAAMLLVACGTDKRHFAIDGRLLNLNQGEFYVYSPDADITKVDTIKVQAGRFSYITECDRPMTLMIVFPNFTEQPVFAEPGKEVDIKGDASHLKELTVKGTKANELMNEFREQILSVSPPEAKRLARQFVEDHPKSIVGQYLVRKYFLQDAQPDYGVALQLIKTMLAQQPENAYLQRLKERVLACTTLNAGMPVPAFSTHDINGTPLSNSALSGNGAAVVVAWASWSYSSINMLRSAVQAAGENVKVIGLCLDPDVATCRATLDKENIDGATIVCDGKMVDGMMFNRLGMYSVPDNIIIKSGRVVAKGLNANDFITRIKSL